MAKKRNNKESFVGLEKNQKLVRELFGSSDRSAAIVGATALEIHLERLIINFLINGKESLSLLGTDNNPNAPLGTFSAKIKAAFCMGLISKNEFEDLEAIRQIRNVFAHHLLDCSFEEDYIKSLCLAFNYVQRNIAEAPEYANDPRYIYKITIVFYDQVLRHRKDSTQNRIVPADTDFDLPLNY